MSPRRRVLVLLVAGVVLVAAVAFGVRWFAGLGPAVDPDSRPDQAAPGPVLLVPGYGGSRESLGALAARIEATGRDAEVLTLAGDGTGDLGAQVEVLDEAVDARLAAGAPSVDVVGYSAGGVVAGLWVAREEGAARARRIVTIGSPLTGTAVAAAGAASAPDACPVACRQLAPGSGELAELARARVGGAVPWLSIWTADDQTVTPPDSARLDGAVNVELQSVCPTARVGHGGLPNDPAVTGLVLRGISADPLAPPTDCASLRATPG
ncbi:esterase/lipase family protein [Pseudonocardia lacus]|uniref:esterase/lipase family protein n=1 Tax=Pseudonocardia lacus TaxID=2835865 RepID=UPI001BDD2043|nr:lipase [Pseudonocardia lacus]